jgi:hypothetical protein
MNIKYLKFNKSFFLFEILISFINRKQVQQLALQIKRKVQQAAIKLSINYEKNSFIIIFFSSLKSLKINNFMKRNICLFLLVIVVILDFFDILLLLSLFRMCIWVFFYYSLTFFSFRNTHKKNKV